MMEGERNCRVTLKGSEKVVREAETARKSWIGRRKEQSKQHKTKIFFKKRTKLVKTHLKELSSLLGLECASLEAWGIWWYPY